jgi:hypothetical protein
LKAGTGWHESLQSSEDFSFIVTPDLIRGLPCLAEEKGGCRVKPGTTTRDGG